MYTPIEVNSKDTRYITQVFNREAVFSDGTRQCRTPEEPDPGDIVTIRIRTAHANASTVVLACGEKRIRMTLVHEIGLFDYYEGLLEVGEDKLRYYFIIWCGDKYYFYNRFGVSEELNEYYDFEIMPGFHTPEWAKGAVMYQIFTDRFANGASTNNVVTDEYYYINGHTIKVTDWYRSPGKNSVREFYGGDLGGVWSKLDYLQQLGVEVIYFNPLFVSPSNHKYDTQDYDYIDPHLTVITRDGGALLPEGEDRNVCAELYMNRVTSKVNLEGSNRFFALFMDEVHKRGMKVILDGVFNHCGSFNKWLDREGIYEKAGSYPHGAYLSEDSQYRDFFKFYRQEWPYNGSYDGWWGHYTLPKLNYEESQELVDYILGVARKWISPPYCVDGWRLDVAADLGRTPEFNHYFWKLFRQEVKKINKDVIILAEHYGDANDWLQGDEWDTVMNYDAFMEPVTWFLTGLEKHSNEYRADMHNNADAFFGAMTHYMSRMNSQSLETAMNELSNHDHSRFLTRTNSRAGNAETLGPEAASEGINKAVMREAIVMQMTWPGAPTLYYGDEAGLCGFTDPDNRRTYPWGREDLDLLSFYREMIAIHKRYDGLKTGSIKFLVGLPGVISYGRFNANERFVVVLNNNNSEVSVDIPVWEVGIEDSEALVRLMFSGENEWHADAVFYHSEHGILKLHMWPFSVLVLKNQPKGLY